MYVKNDCLTDKENRTPKLSIGISKFSPFDKDSWLQSKIYILYFIEPTSPRSRKCCFDHNARTSVPFNGRIQVQRNFCWQKESPKQIVWLHAWFHQMIVLNKCIISGQQTVWSIRLGDIQIGQQSFQWNLDSLILII